MNVFVYDLSGKVPLLKKSTLKVKFENGVAKATLDSIGTGSLKVVVDIAKLGLLGKWTYSLS